MTYESWPHVTTMYAWAIERGEVSRPDYFIGLSLGFALWRVGDGAHEAAIRFARKADATALC